MQKYINCYKGQILEHLTHVTDGVDSSEQITFIKDHIGENARRKIRKAIFSQYGNCWEEFTKKCDEKTIKDSIYNLYAKLKEFRTTRKEFFKKFDLNTKQPLNNAMVREVDKKLSKVLCALAENVYQAYTYLDGLDKVSFVVCRSYFVSQVCTLGQPSRIREEFVTN